MVLKIEFLLFFNRMSLASNMYTNVYVIRVHAVYTVCV